MTTTPWSAEESTERFNYLLERIRNLETEVQKLKHANIIAAVLDSPKEDPT